MLNVSVYTKAYNGPGMESGNIYTDSFYNLDADRDQYLRDRFIEQVICEAQLPHIETEVRFNDEPIEHFKDCKGGIRKVQKLSIHRYEPTKKGGMKDSKRCAWNSSSKETLDKVRRNYIRHAGLETLNTDKTICLQFDDDKPIYFRSGEEIESYA